MTGEREWSADVGADDVGRRCEIVFFFQGEGGIRVYGGTGVQTCALPIEILRSSGPKRLLNATWRASSSFWPRKTSTAWVSKASEIAPKVASSIGPARSTPEISAQNRGCGLAIDRAMIFHPTVVSGGRHCAKFGACYPQSRKRQDGGEIIESPKSKKTPPVGL